MLVTKDGDTIVVPNNQLLTTDVTNYLATDAAASRVASHVALHYRHPPNEVRAVRRSELRVRASPASPDRPAPDLSARSSRESAVVLRAALLDRTTSALASPSTASRTRVWYAARRRAARRSRFPIRTLVTERAAIEDPTDHRLSALGRVSTSSRAIERRRAACGSPRACASSTSAPGRDIIRQDAPGTRSSSSRAAPSSARRRRRRAPPARARSGPGQFFGEMSLMIGRAAARDRAPPPPTRSAT